MSIVFILLRIVTGLAVSGAFALLLAIILLRSTLQFAKESAGVLAYVARLFTSGFTQGTPPPEPAGWLVSLPQTSLALLLIAMLVSVFLPGTKLYLHVVAGLAGIAILWYLRMAFTGAQLEILCLPAFAIWFGYYAMCLFWGGQPLTVVK